MTHPDIIMTSTSHFTKAEVKKMMDAKVERLELPVTMVRCTFCGAERDVTEVISAARRFYCDNACIKAQSKRERKIRYGKL